MKDCIEFIQLTIRPGDSGYFTDISLAIKTNGHERTKLITLRSHDLKSRLDQYVDVLKEELKNNLTNDEANKL